MPPGLRTLVLAICCAVTGCVVPASPSSQSHPDGGIRILPPPTRSIGEVPAAHLPQPMRPYNWVSSRGEGSCANASSVYNLRWTNQLQLADWWRQNHAGGEYESSLMAKHDAAGQRYYYTRSADPQLLEWATRTRRSAVVWFFRAHAVNFVGFHRGPDGVEYAYLCDNNRPNQWIRVERSEFLRRWDGYGGFALVLAAPPVPPPLYDAVARSSG